MKKHLIFIGILILLCPSMIFALGYNRLPNGRFEDTNPFGYQTTINKNFIGHWLFTPNQSGAATPIQGIGNMTSGFAHAENQSAFLQPITSNATISWHSERVAVQTNTSYRFNVWANWSGLNAGLLRIEFKVYNQQLPNLNSGVPGVVYLGNSDTVLASTSIETSIASSNGNWLPFSQNLSIPSSSNGAVAQVVLSLVNADITARAAFDDAQIVLNGPADTTNLIINPGAKAWDAGTVSGSSSYPAYWRRNTSNSTNIDWRTGEEFTTSEVTASFHITHGAVTTGLPRVHYMDSVSPCISKAFIPVNPNYQYSYGYSFCNLQVYKDSDLTGAPGYHGMGITWVNSQDSMLNCLDGSSPAGNNPYVSGITGIPSESLYLSIATSITNWVHLTKQTIPPANAKYAEIHLFNWGQANFHNPGDFFDNLFFQRGPIVVTPSSLILNPGQTKQVQAQYGDTPFVWTSSDTTVANTVASDSATAEITASATLSKTTTILMTVTEANGTGLSITFPVTITPLSAPVYTEMEFENNATKEINGTEF